MTRTLRNIAATTMALAALYGSAALAQGKALRRTPSQTEGPYYTAGAPERTDLTDDATVGIPLLGWITFENGPFWGLIALAGGASILRWPLIFLFRRLRGTAAE